MLKKLLGRDVFAVCTIIWAATVNVHARDSRLPEGTVYPRKETPESRSPLEDQHTNWTTNSTLEIRERFLSSLVIGVGTFLTKVALGFVEKEYVNEKQGNHTCHRNVCFYPEYGLGLEVGGPVTPEVENTTFIFFDERNSSGTEVNETTWENFYSNFTGNISKPLIAIAHGFSGSGHSQWVVNLRNSLLENVDCNVLVVDWQHRAEYPYYAKAASSAPLVGVILSFMLKKIIQTSNCSLLPDNVHIIGFSLGAHAAGVCGRHYYENTGYIIGRITGLDPAGPLFEHSNVSLSSADAKFVDVTHTNAGNFTDGRFGLNKSIGHVDFYPNGGNDQPNCVFATDPGCSHQRAHALFTESLNRSCTFKSYYCSGGWNAFLTGNCSEETNSSYIGDMGYYSFNASGRGNQYLNTSGTPPFCIPRRSE